ncbi:MAG: hypothetical protein IPI67_17165 [Myxococcales bacterium]|nr:hypothetical protein [Myxococcales bacterium]
MAATKSLSELQLEDFDAVPIWRTVTGDCDAETVALLTQKLTVDPDDFELWVRVHGVMKNGSRLVGIARAQGDPAQLDLFSFLIGSSWVPLIFKPAPDFVLTRQGPAPFCSRLGLPVCEFRTHLSARSDGT